MVLNFLCMCVCVCMCACACVCALAVCSTTLWVGQLDKKTQQSDLMSVLEEFGQIESINVSLDNSKIPISLYDLKVMSSTFSLLSLALSVQMIPPRGCAYIVMVHRQDAYTALSKLRRGSYKVNQKPVKVCLVLFEVLLFYM